MPKQVFAAARSTVETMVTKEDQELIRSAVLANLSAYLPGASRATLIQGGNVGALSIEQPTHFLWTLFKAPHLQRILSERLAPVLDGNLVVNAGGFPDLEFSLTDEKPGDDYLGLTTESLDFYARTRPLNDLGDGTQAFVGLVAAAIALPFAVAAIDEPEMLLHPPLARRLGAELARSLRECGGTLVAATHSSAFVLGVIEASLSTTVIRLSRTSARTSARVTSGSRIRQLMAEPLLRTTKTFEALFHSAAVITEGDTDRVFYEELEFRRRSADPNCSIADLLFLSTLGWKSIHKIARALREFGVPIATIMDFDTLFGPEADWQRIHDAFGIPNTEAAAIEKLRDLLKKAAKTKSPKEYGVSAFDEATQSVVRQLLEKLEEHGIFIVPEGEVESWFPLLGINVGKNCSFAERLALLGNDETSASYVRPDAGGPWTFMSAITTWLRSERAQYGD